ncbi:hypothetical protein EDD85DRAFT_803358 [Armillaria nabsnona]|nr:hypothetical protein EDD85DRAFT_803358 [Armillaria nabsnona]
MSGSIQSILVCNVVLISGYPSCTLRFCTSISNYNSLILFMVSSSVAWPVHTAIGGNPSLCNTDTAPSSPIIDHLGQTVASLLLSLAIKGRTINASMERLCISSQTFIPL